MSYPRLEELESFVALAEFLHFTDAADSLDISQTMLSRHIRQLEDMFNATLFVRSTRRVKLSEEGKAFLPSAKRILQEIERSRESVGAVKRGDLGSLHIGYVASASIRTLPKILQKLRTKHADLQIGLTESFDDELVNAVRDGQLDVAITRTSNVRSDLSCVPVGPRHAVCAVLKRGDQLAKRKQISIDTLRKHGVIIWPRALDAIDRNMLESAFSRSGYNVSFDGSNVTAHTVLSLVAMGAGVGLLAEPFADLKWPEISFVPITGRWSQLHIISRADNDSSSVREFLATI